MDAIFIDDLKFHWRDERGFGLVVPQLRVAQGEKVLLLGASGSGKSTLLSLICGFVLAQSGRVAVEDVDLAALPPAKRDRFRAEMMGVIFQQFNLLPYANVSENIRLPLQFARERRARIEDVDAEIARLCEMLKLPEESLGMKAGELSVGQQQRVAAARALIGAPPIVIADEPTSALDADAQSSFLELLFEQEARAGSTVLMVSHDERLAGHFDRAVRLEDILEKEVASA